MVLLKRKVLIALLVFSCSTFATVTITADADFRYSVLAPDSQGVYWPALGFSARKTFSDLNGDRFTLYGLAEISNNFSKAMVHQLYLKYKGPIGKWNLTAGRFILPYGLLTNYSTDRLLHQSVVDKIIGFDSDDGIMVSGIVNRLEYGLSLTRGAGNSTILEYNSTALLTGRVGYLFGDFDEYTVGLSSTTGTTEGHSGMRYTESKTSFALDVTANVGRTVIRSEFSHGVQGDLPLTALFAAVDFAAHSKLEINLGGTLLYSDEMQHNRIFTGLSFTHPWFTARGGLYFEHSEKDNYGITLQVYRLFSASF